MIPIVLFAVACATAVLGGDLLGGQEIALKQVTIVVLSKGPHWTDADTAEHNDLQRRHAAYRLKLAHEGMALAAGPIEADFLGAEYRGFSLFLDRTAEEIAALQAADPKIAAGHLTYRVIKWHIPSATYDDLMALLERRRQGR